MLKTTMLYTVLFTGLCLGWFMLQRSDHLPVNTVKVASTYVHLSQESVQAAIIPYVTDGFFSVPVKALKENVLKLPWAAQVSVTRIWPDTLLIRIIEQKAVARWNKNSLLSAQGDLILPDEEDMPTNIPYLQGPSGQHTQVMRQYRLMNKMLKPLGFGILNLELTNRRAWCLQLNNGMTLLLGRHDANNRLNRFVKAYHHVFGSHGSDADRVDLRYSNGMSVHWRS